MGYIKTKSMLLVILTLTAVITFGGMIWWYTPCSIIDINPTEVSKINIFNGTTGKAITITVPAEVEHIIENLNCVSLEKDKVSLGYMGYHYRVTIYNAGGKVYKEFIINSSSNIRKDPFFYRDISESIDIDYIQALFKVKEQQNAPQEVNANSQPTTTPIKEEPFTNMPELIGSGDEVAKPQDQAEMFSPFITSDSKDLGSIAGELMAAYFNHYTTDSIPEDQRLLSFKLNQIRIISQSAYGFMFYLDYSVQGASEKTSWTAGNGKIRANGLVEGKVWFVRVAKEGETYKMLDAGTSP